MKSRPAAERGRPLAGRVLAMIFDQPSTRTRVSFDVAMRQLGGETIMLTGAEMQLGRGETMADTARVLSRYVDAIMIRILDHDMLKELAEYATVPVINGLTRRSHPCQIDGRPPHLRGASRAGSRAQDRLVRRRQQRARLAGARLVALRLHARRRLAAGASAAGRATRMGEEERRGRAFPDRPGGGGRRRRRRHHRHLGLHGRRRARAPPQSSEALPGERRASWKKPSPTPYSCIACPPIAARRSPPR